MKPSKYLSFFSSLQENKTFSVYPNPASEDVTIAFVLIPSGVVRITIFDFMGNIVLEKQASCLSGSNTLDLNTRALQTGRYTVMLTAGEHVQVQPLMVID